MGAELEVKFTTKYEEEGARNALAGIQRQIGAAKAAGESYTELEAKAKKLGDSIAKMSESGKGGMFGELKQGLEELHPAFGKVFDLVGKMASGPLGLLAAGFTALAGALEVGKRGLEEYAQAQERVAGLQAALAQSGQLTNEYSAALQELAHGMQVATSVAAADWIPVLTRLTQFGADSSNIEEYTDAVKNLAGLMGGDIQSAANLFSRAMQGNFEAFSRYGIVVEDAGTQTEKLDKLMTQLALRGGGQLEATANTLNGQFRQLKNNTADLFEGIGRGIASTGLLQTILQGLSDAAETYAEKLGGPIEKLDGLTNAAQTNKTALLDDKTAFEQFTRVMQDRATASTLSAGALQHQVTKAQALKAALDAIEEEEKKLARLAVEKLRLEGKINAVEEQAMLGAIDKRFAASAQDRESVVRQAEATAAKGTADQVRYDAAVAKGRLDRNIAGPDPNRALEVAKGRFRELAEAKQEFEKEKKQKPSNWAINALTPYGLGGVAQATAMVQAAEHKKRMEELKMRIEGLEKLTGGASKPEATPQVVSAVERAKERAALKKDADDKEAKIPFADAAYKQAKELLDIANQGAARKGAVSAQVSDLNTQNEKTKAQQGINEGVKTDIGHFKSASGEGDPQAYATLMQELGKFRESHKSLAEALEEVFGKNNQTIRELLDVIDGHSRNIDNLKSQLNELRNR